MTPTPIGPDSVIYVELIQDGWTIALAIFSAAVAFLAAVASAIAAIAAARATRTASSAYREEAADRSARQALGVVSSWIGTEPTQQGVQISFHIRNGTAADVTDVVWTAHADSVEVARAERPVMGPGHSEVSSAPADLSTLGAASRYSQLEFTDMHGVRWIRRDSQLPRKIG